MATKELVSKDDIAALRAEAIASVEKEILEAEKQRLLNGFVAEEKRARGAAPLVEPLIDVTVDVPACCIVNLRQDTGVSVNGMEFHHGVTYKLPLSVAGLIKHSIFIANKNEAAIGHPNRDMVRNKVIDGRTGTVIDANA